MVPRSGCRTCPTTRWWASTNGIVEYRAQHKPDLVRVIKPVAELSRIWRMLTTPELRRTPRVAAFFDFIVSEIDTLRPIITG